MKATKLILSAAIALISVFSITAQDIIPVDSIQLLNEVQKKTLQDTKIMLNGKHNKIKLPFEFNDIIGKSEHKKYYESRVNWDGAYFINAGDSVANLVIPMQVKVDTTTINSSLNIIMNLDEDKYSVVRTLFTLQGEGNAEYMCLQSSINGFLSSTLFIEGDSIVSEVKGKDYEKAILYTAKNGNKNEVRKDLNRMANRRYKSATDLLEYTSKLPNGYKVEPKYLY